MQSPIRATLNAKPRLIFPVMRCDNSVLPRTTTALAKLPLPALAAHVVVPVQKRMHKTTLLQETAPAWDRHLVTNRDLGSPHFSSPVLLSSRDRWHINEETSEIFDRAVVIDGAKRLEAAFAFPSMQDIPVTIVYGLNSDIELSLRSQLQNSYTSTARIEIRERIGTTAPRLTIEDDWVDVELCSDPFVVPNSRGYSPAILVRRPAAHHSEHLLIGARSLAVELESLRCNHGTLLGAHISVRKQGPERTAPYLLHVRETPKD